MNFLYNGKPAPPGATKVCVLYDPEDDGRIVHVHTVTTFPGGRAVDEKEVERRAFIRAKAAGRSTEGLKALHVSPSDISPSMRYRVDVEMAKLIELMLTAKPAKQAKPAKKAQRRVKKTASRKKKGRR